MRIKTPLSDLKGLQTHVATEVDRKEAEIRLELMTHREIMGNLCTLILFALISVVVAILCVGLASTAEFRDPSSYHYSQTYFVPTLLTLDYVVRLVSLGLMIVMLLTFVRKVIQKSLKKHENFSGEQSMVVLCVILFLIGPGAGVYPMIIFGTRFQKFLDLLDMEKGESDIAEPLLSPSHALYREGQDLLSTVATVFTTSSFNFLYLILKSTLSRPRDYSQEGVAEVNPNTTERTIFSCKKSCSSCWKIFAEPFEHVEMPVARITGLTFTYFIATVTACRIFDFNPSFVPFVAIIPLIKVCLIDVESFFRLHNETVEGKSRFDPGKSFCVADEVLGRTISQLIIFLIEIVLLLYSMNATKATRTALKKLPYIKYRARHLGYQFFSFTTSILFVFGMLNSLLLVLIPQAELWVIGFENNKFIVDPLHIMGLPAEALGMSSIFLLLTATFLSWAFAYLPASETAAVHVLLQGLRRTIFHPCQCKTSTEAYQEETIYFCKEADLDEVMIAFNRLPDCLSQKTMPSLRSIEIETRLSTTKSNRKINNTVNKKLPKRFITAPTKFSSESKKSVTIQRHESSAKNLNEHIPEERLRFQASRRGIIVFETITQSFSLAHLTYDFVEQFGAHAVKQLTELLTAQEMSKEQQIRKLSRKKNIIVFNKPRFSCCSPRVCDDGLPMVQEEDKYMNSQQNYDITSSGRLSIFDAETIIYTFLPKQFSRFLGPTEQVEVAYYLHNKTWDSHCIILNGDDRVLVGFRGTVSALNARADLDLVAIPYYLNNLVQLYANQNGSDVFLEERASKMFIHRGFTNSYVAFEKSILDCVATLLQKNPKKVLCTTGHSLGGALATICALSLKLHFNVQSTEYYTRIHTLNQESKPEVIVCSHTYGSPKVGNHVFKQVFQTLIPACLRLVFVGDLIPSLPPSHPFAHITKNGYYHVGVRILLDLQGNMVIAPNFTERMIYNMLKGFKLQRHFKGSYSLGLMTWNARTNGSNYVPDWWLPIINHLFVNFSTQIVAYPEDVKGLLLLQMNKEEAIYVSDNVIHRHAAVQTSLTGIEAEKTLAKA